VGGGGDDATLLIMPDDHQRANGVLSRQEIAGVHTL
jgi:hypothetical protein